MASGQGRGRSSSGKGRAPSGKSSNRGGRTQAVRKTKKTAQAAPMDAAIRNEILLIAFLALAIVLFLCNFGVVGSIGDAVSGVMFGIFGLTAYVAPIFLFLAIAFGMSNTGNSIAVRKLISGVILFLLAGMVCELFAAKPLQADVWQPGEIYARCSEAHSGGGIIAGSLVCLSCRFLGMVGTVLLILVLGIICAVIVTERSFIGGVRKHGKRMYERSVEDAAYRRERAEERRAAQAERRDREEERRRQKKEEIENEKILRMDRKVSGVMLDPSLDHEKEGGEADAERVRDDLHEIVLNEDTEETDRRESAQISARGSYIENASDAMHEIRIHGAADEEDEPKEAFPVPSDEAGAVSRTADPAGMRVRSGAAVDGERVSGAQETETVRERQTAVRPYRFPPLTLLAKGSGRKAGDSARELKETAERLRQTLDTFGVRVTITDISQGPSVTRYELQPELGVKVSKIVGLADDIKLNLAATDIRIEAPIPGKAAVGIEVPNKENSAVAFRDLVESPEFKNFPSNLAFAVGKDIAGKIVVADIAKMPHMLIAGATGSGKSVCINTIIMGILYKAKPEDVKMIMVDPKVVELSVYNGIPHLLIPW